MTKQMMYREILRSYELRRNDAARILHMRQEELYEKEKKIQAIDAELNLLGIQTARLGLDNFCGNEQEAEIYTRKTKDLVREKHLLITALGYPDHYLTPEYQCNFCSDTGFVGNEKCICFKQKFLELAYKDSNLADMIQTENFEAFSLAYYSEKKDAKEGLSPRENMQRIHNKCIDFLECFEQEKQNLMFYGNTGLGKSFLCYCIAKELLTMGYTVLYLTAFQLFKMIEEHKFRPAEEDCYDDYFDTFLDADLMIIDDLGTEFSSIVSSSELFNIINVRLLKKSATIISTNLSMKDFVDIYSDRVVSRIQGNYLLLKFFGEDIRIKKKYKMK